MVSASLISCGNSKFRGTYELAVGESLILSRPTSEFYDPIRRTGPFIAYEGSLAGDLSAEDDSALVGRGRHNQETDTIEIDRAVRVPVLDGSGIDAENGEIFYELIHIANDGDGIPENNVLIFNLYY